MLIFGGADSPRLGAPIHRVAAANAYAAAVNAIVRPERDESTKFYPVTDSDSPKILVREPKKQSYVRIRDNWGEFIHGVVSNEVGAEAAKLCAGYEPSHIPDETPASQKLGFGFGAFFGDRDRFLCAVTGLLDPTSPDFLTREVPMTFPPALSPAEEPEVDAPRDFSRIDEEFEAAKLNPSPPVPDRIVPLPLGDQDFPLPVHPIPEEVGARLAGVAKWLLTRVRATTLPADVEWARRRLHFFVRAAELSPPSVMRETVANAILCDIVAVRAAIRPLGREAG